MCRRPVGRMPLKTLALWSAGVLLPLSPLFFPLSPIVTLAPRRSLQKSRFLATLEMTIVVSVSNMNTEWGRAEARPYNVLLTRCNLLFLSSEQFSRNDHPLHFAGPLIHGDHPRVPVHSLPIRLPRLTHL